MGSLVPSSNSDKNTQLRKYRCGAHQEWASATWVTNSIINISGVTQKLLEHGGLIKSLKNVFLEENWNLDIHY